MKKEIDYEAMSYEEKIKQLYKKGIADSEHTKIMKSLTPVEVGKFYQDMAKDIPGLSDLQKSDLVDSSVKTHLQNYANNFKTPEIESLSHIILSPGSKLIH